MSHRWFIGLFAVAILIPLYSYAQPSAGTPADDSLASYIKAWRWESVDGKSAIDVSSSGLMLFDGNLYDYDLSGGALRFVSGGRTVPYHYDPATDRLTFDFADTLRIAYHRTIQSVLARRGTRRLPEQAEFLFGRFSTADRRTSNGTLESKTINFHANTEFDFGPRESAPTGGAAGGAGSQAALGTALVYEDEVIFSFYDSSAAEADVQTRDSRGDVRSFVYADEVYSRVPYEAAMYPTPTPYPVPEPYPGPPPYPIPPMDPPYYPPYYPPYHPPVYYPHYYPHYYPPVVIGGHVAPPHSGGGKDGKAGGETRTTGTHRGSGGSGSGTVSSPGRSSRSSGSSAGGSSGSRGGSSGGSSRGGNRR